MPESKYCDTCVYLSYLHHDRVCLLRLKRLNGYECRQCPSHTSLAQLELKVTPADNPVLRVLVLGCPKSRSKYLLQVAKDLVTVLKKHELLEVVTTDANGFEHAVVDECRAANIPLRIFKRPRTTGLIPDGICDYVQLAYFHGIDQAEIDTIDELHKAGVPIFQC